MKFYIKSVVQGCFGFFQVGKGKKWNFPGGEKQELPGILPEQKHTILRAKKLKTCFCQKFQGEFPLPYEKTLIVNARLNRLDGRN